MHVAGLCIEQLARPVGNKRWDRRFLVTRLSTRVERRYRFPMLNLAFV
jgi:hypothetical protein